LHGQKNHSEQKKRMETKPYRSDSTWFFHHLDPILRNNFSCRSESTEKPILAVTDTLMLNGVDQKWFNGYALVEGAEVMLTTPEICAVGLGFLFEPLQ
jgi:hypothetical protein